MRKPIAALLFIAGLLAATDAKGQYIVSGASLAPTPTWSGTPFPSQSLQAGTVQPARIYPYSYYVAIPHQARGYVGYGSNDTFPFYGVPYGHPYDPWTWPYMSGSYNRSLARYYDPPVK